MSEQTKTEHWNMVAELLADESDTMTDWELTFIEDMDKRRESGLSLTPNMRAKIEQVWEKVNA